MKGRAAIILLFTFMGLSVFGQNPNKTRAINNYVSFVNESIHGLLIAHRLFENYNQILNQYVDLPDYKLNNYSNADLPNNIFIDQEQWFYDRAPYEWYDIAIRESKYLGSNAQTINQHISEIKKLLKEINTKRLRIANTLENSDLTQSSNLQSVYSELESVVSLYNRFYDVYRAIDDHFLSTHKLKIGTESFETSFRNFYRLAKIQLDNIRNNRKIDSDDLDHINRVLTALEKEKKSIEPQIRKRILTNTSRLVKSFRDFVNNKKIPLEYELYGSYYYYYNILMLNRTNRYGNGFVKEFNNAAQKNELRMVTEVPQLYKVIYPKKLPKEELTELNDDKLIQLLEKELTPTFEPKQIKLNTTVIPEPEDIDRNRGIIVHQEKIYVNSDSFDLELYDHLIKDGDRVSININGEWKFKNISLEKEPQVITIHIVPGQNNFILVHADNTGYRPPNTVALAYMLNGERKEINLQADLQNSQMVEIKYQSN